MGQIACDEWHESFIIRRELSCEIFCLMPNHLHAIVTLVRDQSAQSVQYAQRAHPANPPSPQSKFVRKPKSISSFVGGFKSSVTTKINDLIDNNPDKHLFPSLGKFSKQNKLWQPNYHDHIIRDENEYHRIYQYIATNSSRWREDKFFFDDLEKR
jgi:putative transposase